jgi:vancomycin resistance protein YoaR
MAENTKSATTTPKPRKTAAKKKAADTPSNVTEITVTREQRIVNREISKEEIARLAHQLWNERGRQHGRDADDWLQAEQLLRGKAS